MTTKKVLAALLAATLSTTMLFGCGSSSDSDPAPAANSGTMVEAANDTEAIEYVDPADFAKVYTNPETYKEKGIKFTGQVFSVEEDEDGIYLQVYADPDNFDKNTIVGYTGKDVTIQEDDYVFIDGIIMGEFEGENLFGETVTAPSVLANSITVTDYIEAVVPALKTYENCGSITQHNVVVSIDKIELAEKETRVYVTVQNTSEKSFQLYTFDCNIIQDGKQYGEEYNYNYDSEEFTSDSIRSGAEVSGIITLQTISQDSDFKLYLDGQFDDYEPELEPFVFEIKAE